MSNALGLPLLDPNLSFLETFDSVFANLLGGRAEGFRTIFTNLVSNPRIVETGCLRAVGNWSGDGQSTYLFNFFTRKNGGSVHSIDVNQSSIERARELCPETSFYVGDGAKTILQLINLYPIIDLLYLDSFDAFRDVSVIPAPVHYLVELCAAWPLLRRGSLVAIDDIHSAEAPGQEASKGLGVGIFMEAVGAEVLHDNYIKVWKI